MAHTPYPGSNNRCENPSIVVSYDGINWFEPAGIENPVSGLPPTFNNRAHYSDCHLLMRNETMELWFRHNGGQSKDRIADNDGATILRITSTDGIHWTEPEIMVEKNGRQPYLSPAVVWDNGFYTMWYTTMDGKLYRMTAYDGKNWSDPEATDLSYPKHKVWHQDVQRTDLGYETIFCAKAPDNTGDNQRKQKLFYAMSEDGMHWTEPVQIMAPGKADGAFDNDSIYRSSLVKMEDSYRIYYTGMGWRYRWYVSMCEGETISDLTGWGVTEEELAAAKAKAASAEE